MTFENLAAESKIEVASARSLRRLKTVGRWGTFLWGVASTITALAGEDTAVFSRPAPCSRCGRGPGGIPR